ncbi:ImmA/IrrE family metallo-endopeptidase [Pseudomonas alvandae]|uniref:ImmA/IrrE family metallo-endopeptidase n=1 Tax=Pseudomonas canavaninivorans TaxID=2842348 RepID=UPI003D6518FD
MEKSKPRGVRVAPLSSRKIREVAEEFRVIFSLPPGNVDIIELYEFGLQSKGWDYDIQEDNLFPSDVLALAFPDRHLIRVKQSVWSGAVRGDRMSRFTLAHELGHLILHNSDRLGFARHHPSSPRSHNFYEDSEWQADRFAAELLIPAGELSGMRLNASQIAVKYGVSKKSAGIRICSLRKEGYLE